MTGPTNSADFLVPEAGGSLEVSDWGEHIRRDAVWLVSDDGRLFDMTWAAAAFGAAWSPLFIRSMPTESWKLIRIDSVEDLLRLAGAGGNALEPIASVKADKDYSNAVRAFEGLLQDDD